MAGSNYRNDSVEVLFSQLGSGWQTEPAIEEILAHSSSSNPTPFKHRLEVHGLPGGLGCFDEETYDLMDVPEDCLTHFLQSLPVKNVDLTPKLTTISLGK